ncbi:MAG TPA: rod shape-determining protein [Candidatus Saccharimonadia bacterium]|nr:rod shape-determining protein [Candidatus Saccharimonadia bacterium]
MFSQDIGIDLGTANTVILVKGKGIVIEEPSVVARMVRGKAVVAIGSAAKKMIGKTPKSIEAIRPLRDGVIADFDAAEAMLNFYIHTLTSGNIVAMLFRPTVLIGIPSGVTEVEQRAVQSAALAAGAGKAYLIEEPMAAAIGAGINVLEPQGRMIVDIGGGTTEIAVISLGGIVLNKSLRVAGDELDEAVQAFVRMHYGLMIGESTAEQTKIAIGSAYPFEKDGKKTSAAQFVVRGRDVESGLPRSVSVSSVQLREALAPIVQQIVNAIMDTLEETPPELASDILEHGLALAGGSSQLKGLEQRISEETRMPVWTANEPHRAVARGCGIALENPALLAKVRISGSMKR